MKMMILNKIMMVAIFIYWALTMEQPPWEMQLSLLFQRELVAFEVLDIVA